MMKPLVGILLLTATVETAVAQVCRVSMAGATRNRKIINPVYTECGGDPINCIFFLPVEHSIPFGNWGATSNFGQKQDSHQFQGWCHNSWITVNGQNKEECKDGWWEWNSCYQWPHNPPNCTLFNADNCFNQQTTTGNNIHGTTGYDAGASCPMDTNGDGQCDTGGCLYSSSVGTYNNYMSLYELDKCDEDELVQSLYFPPTVVNSTCSVWGCNAAGSAWVTPNFYQSPSSHQVVHTEMALVFNGAYFLDPYGTCDQMAQYDNRYNCW